MALWGSKQPDLQSRIDDIQSGLAALAGLLGDGATAAGKGAARGARAAGETASGAAGSLGPLLNDLSSQIDSVVSSASALTSDLARRGAKEGKAAYRAVEARVEDNAMIAVLAAAGVGFLVGSMMFGGGAAKRAVSNVLPDALGGNARQPQRRGAARSRRRTGGRSRRSAA